MKIAIIIEQYIINNDSNLALRGAFAYIYNIVQSLALNAEADILCIDTNVDVSKNPHVIKFANLDDITSEYLKKSGYQFVWNATRAEIKSDGFVTFDFVHSQSRIYRHKYVRRPFELFIQSIFDRKRFFSDKKIKEYKENYKHADIIFVNSELQKWDYVHLMGLSEDSVLKLTPCINKNENIITKENNSTFTFGMSAITFDLKGGYIFLRALSMLKKVNKNFKAKIIYPHHKQNIFVNAYIFILGLKNNVEFLDFQQEMEKFYSKIDCLVMASREETFGLVALEAMQQKLPVIVPDIAGAAEIIKNEENGFVFETGKQSAKNLAKVLEKVLNNQKLNEIALMGYETANNCSLEKYAEDLNSMLEVVYKKRRNML